MNQSNSIWSCLTQFNPIRYLNWAKIRVFQLFLEPIQNHISISNVHAPKGRVFFICCLKTQNFLNKCKFGETHISSIVKILSLNAVTYFIRRKNLPYFHPTLSDWHKYFTVGLDIFVIFNFWLLYCPVVLNQDHNIFV